MKIERCIKHRKNKLENGYCLVWYVLKQKFVMKSQIQKRRHILFKTEDNVQSQPSMNSILIQERKKIRKRKKARSSRPGTTVNSPTKICLGQD